MLAFVIAALIRVDRRGTGSLAHGWLSAWPLWAPGRLLRGHATTSTSTGSTAGSTTRPVCGGCTRRITPWRDVDWLAGSRSHALEILINQTIEFAPDRAARRAPEVPLIKATISAVWGMWIHSNIDVRTGRLQWIVNGPEAHRWHHAVDLEAHDRNFATKLAIWDRLFGTAFLPRGASPPATASRGRLSFRATWPSTSSPSDDERTDGEAMSLAYGPARRQDSTRARASCHCARSRRRTSRFTRLRSRPLNPPSRWSDRERFRYTT